MSETLLGKLAESLWTFDGYDNRPSDPGVVERYLAQARDLLPVIEGYRDEVRVADTERAIEVLDGVFLRLEADTAGHHHYGTLTAFRVAAKQGLLLDLPDRLREKVSDG